MKKNLIIVLLLISSSFADIEGFWKDTLLIMKDFPMLPTTEEDSVFGYLSISNVSKVNEPIYKDFVLRKDVKRCIIYETSEHGDSILSKEFVIKETGDILGLYTEINYQATDENGVFFIKDSVDLRVGNECLRIYKKLKKRVLID